VQYNYRISVIVLHNTNLMQAKTFGFNRLYFPAFALPSACTWTTAKLSLSEIKGFVARIRSKANPEGRQRRFLPCS
jgi:hypothetical protein